MTFDPTIFSGKIEKSEIFMHLILDEIDVLILRDNNISFRTLAEQCQVDFIAVRKYGQISFRHFASMDSYDFINQNGLHSKDPNSILDLGDGVYVIRSKYEDVSGYDNVLNWLGEHLDHHTKEMLLVEGTYDGEYHECVYGYQHEGYIVLKTPVPAEKIENISDVDVDLMFGYY